VEMRPHRKAHCWILGSDGRQVILGTSVQRVPHGCRSVKIIGEGWPGTRERRLYSGQKKYPYKKKNSPDLAHFILRIGNFCLSSFIIFFSKHRPNIAKALCALAMTLKMITVQDNWMTVDLPEASDRSRPIA